MHRQILYFINGLINTKMSHILDRHQYDPKMITNIEVMAAYFVDLFYNHLYFEGKKFKVNGNVPSITEGYKHALNAFIKSLSNARLYKKAVIGIHQYFMNYTSFTTISFAKCVDRLAENFVPLDYYSSLNNTQKMSILRLVINQAIKNFTKKIVNDHLNKIIDHHKEPDNVRLLQDELIDCFLLEREGVYQRFVSTQTKTNTNETVNRLVAEKMQKEIKNLILEKIQLKKQNAALKQIIVKNSKELEQLRETVGTMESTNNELKANLAELKNGKQSSSDTNLRYTESNEFSEVDKQDFIQVSHQNLNTILNNPSKLEFPVSIDSNESNLTQNVEIEEEPPSSPESQKPSPISQKPSPISQDKDFVPTSETSQSSFSNFPVPKKRKGPSSELGEGLTLDDFF